VLEPAIKETEMAKVKWLGEGDEGPEETQAFGKTFKVGESVEITDEEQLNSAKGNQYFDVAGDKSPTIEDDPELMAPIPGPAALGDQVKNAAFGTQEELDAHREMSIEAAERNEEIQAKRGRPRGSKNKSSEEKAAKREAKKASKKTGAKRGPKPGRRATIRPEGGQDTGRHPFLGEK
jgi:hypothetical protein